MMHQISFRYDVFYCMHSTDIVTYSEPEKKNTLPSSFLQTPRMSKNPPIDVVPESKCLLGPVNNWNFNISDARARKHIFAKMGYYF
jgi:hypothetical protein